MEQTMHNRRRLLWKTSFSSGNAVAILCEEAVLRGAASEYALCAMCCWAACSHG